MKFNLSLKKKYSNKVSTISYSAWNEPLSALINQQDPLMRAFKDYIACFFFSINFPEMKMFKIVQQTGWAGKALSATFVKSTWSFLTSYVVESYLEGCPQLQTLTENLIKMLKSDILEMGNIKQQKSRSTKNC